MKSKKSRFLAVVLSFVMAVGCFFSFAGCATGGKDQLDALASEVSMLFMGNNIFNWNAFAVDPEGSFGYVDPGYEPSWYEYAPMTADDARMVDLVFRSYKNRLKKIKLSSLDTADAATYRAIEHMLNVQGEYYASPFVVQFDLIDGGYVSSEGGYVADFASSCENFIFRSEADVQKLLTVAESTKTAFATYANYARDRKSAGYALADSTLKGMKDYLNSVVDKGDDYYLYGVINDKIDKASFLTDAQKAEYKTEFKAAIDNKFMSGVKSLAKELDKYMGEIPVVNSAYLANYGALGEAYYEWLFYSRTGIKDADLVDTFDELLSAVKIYNQKCDDIIEEVLALEETDSATFDEFNAYYTGERALFDLTEPEDIIEYLIDAAKAIVPDLETLPEIGFKYMDETEASVSSAVAYYVKSPIDEQNSTEYITINPNYVGKDTESLSTIAHEGYPGHLYAHVNAKENGASLMSTISSNLSFSEGWAQYAELKILQNIAESDEYNKAVKLYADYLRYDTMSGYTNSVINDMAINYGGFTVNDFVDVGASEEEKENVRQFIGQMMERPGVYVPYGYGMYYIVSLHEKAQTELGDKYDEIEFNRALLADGFAPTLPRATEITNEYIKSAKAA